MIPLKNMSANYLLSVIMIIIFTTMFKTIKHVRPLVNPLRMILIIIDSPHRIF